MDKKSNVLGIDIRSVPLKIIVCFLILLTVQAHAQSYEAESGALSNGASLQSCSTCSGQSMVGDLGNGAVTIPVTAAATGVYNLTISYCTGDQRTISVTLNGGSVISVTCPASGGWSTVGTTQITVPLVAGSNSIKLDNAYGYGPNIDKISLSAINAPDVKTISFGTNNHIDFDLANGYYDVYFDNKKIIGEAFSYANSNTTFISNQGFTKRQYASAPVTDHFGTGTRHVITMSGDGMLEMQQVFYTYNGKNYFFTETLLNGTGSNSYKMSPLTSNLVDIHANADKRALFVPYDNDKWVRYEAKEIRYANFTSSEAGSIYDNTSRKGLVIGSVEHDTWKTGVNLAGEGRGETSYVSVIAGFTSEDVTRDKRGHGWVSVGQNSCKSPKILVSYDNDWRNGFDDYGKANATAESRYVFDWTAATPFGWNSWGAVQSGLTLPKAKSVVDYFADDLAGFRNGDNTLYIDLDSYWDNLAPGGMTGNFSQLTEFANYCKSKGFKPGIYWAPFVDWGKNSRTMEGSAYNYDEVWTRVNGEAFDLDGAYALDPTHPATKARIAYLIAKFKASGFEMIKIDFLSHAGIEADGFYQPGIHTGMQAYKVGMEYLIDQLDGSMLVYAAISPNLATGRYAHMRRIACDTYKDISETAYSMNSSNYGWWQNHIYQYMDADHVVFGTESEGENRARLASSIVTGTIIMGDDYSASGSWKARSQVLLQNADLLNLAKNGKIFRPVEGNTGWDPSEVFVQTIGNKNYIAVFNYGQASKTFTIDLARAGFDGSTTFQAKELFSGSNPEAKMAAAQAQGTITITVPASDAAIVQLTDIALPVTLKNFKATKLNNSSLIQWQTTAEKNNKEFVVERSSDAVKFSAIATVPGNGDSGKEHSYQLTDSTPVRDSVNYYRLRQNDYNGQFEYSQIVAVDFTGLENTVSLYPNPASTQVSVKLNKKVKGKLYVKIEDITGLTIITRSFNNPSETITMPGIGRLGTGVYILTLQDEHGEIQKLRFVKN
jgi:alpha-galactosidase